MCLQFTSDRTGLENGDPECMKKLKQVLEDKLQQKKNDEGTNKSTIQLFANT